MLTLAACVIQLFRRRSRPATDNMGGDASRQQCREELMAWTRVYRPAIALLFPPLSAQRFEAHLFVGTETNDAPHLVLNKVLAGKLSRLRLCVAHSSDVQGEQLQRRIFS
jgi:hypothetical protein